MKRIKGLPGLLAAAALIGTAATSCNNNLNDLNGGKPAASLEGSIVKTPDAIVWSGKQTFGNTFTGTRSEGVTGDVYANNYSAPKTRVNEESPVTITSTTVTKDAWDYEAAAQYADEKLPEGNINIDDLDDIDFDFIFYAKDGDMEFEIYPVLCNTNRNPQTIGIFYFDKEGRKIMIPLQTDFNPYTVRGSEPLPGWRINVKQGYKFGFYWGCIYQIYNESNPYYPYLDRSGVMQFTSSNLNEEAYVKNNGQATGEFQQIRAGIFYQYTNDEQTEGITYIGTEDWDDFDFQDIVFACNDIIHTVSQDNTEWGKEDGDDPTPPNNRCPNNHEEIPNSGCTHNKSNHTWHEDSQSWTCDICESNDQHSDCNPCPQEHGDDCHHAGSLHDEDGYCPECGENDPCHKPDETCDVPGCGHPKHDGHDCEQCPEGTTCHPNHDTPSTPTDPSDPTQKPAGNEVEINLSILDVHTLPNGDAKYDIDDLVSKLSMHVRYPHDIEVIIPVPESVYCDQDDLYILKTHDVGQYVYGGEDNRLAFEIGCYVMQDGKPVPDTNEDGSIKKDDDGNVVYKLINRTVILGVQFVPAEEDNLTNKQGTVTTEDNQTITRGGYIRVYTEGICPELIDFLKYYYGDGINFEVYNYFNRGTQYTTEDYPEITYECLQYNFLSHSFVNFDWDETGEKVLPDYYINAFNEINLLPVKGDCYTWIIGDNHADNGVYVENGTIDGSNTRNIYWGTDKAQKASFANPYQGYHYNGSKFNWIYKLKAIGGEDKTEMQPAIWPFNNNGSFWQYFKYGDDNEYNFGQ